MCVHLHAVRYQLEDYHTTTAGHRPLEEGGSPSAEAATKTALLPGLLRGDGARELAVLAPEEDLLVPLLVRGALYLVRLILQSWNDLERDSPAY